ncbi:phosphatidylinositol 3,4,5-trisphosphate 3-phosphatase and protein-tyrosine-phosphatase PTEN1-like isoform X3 [Cucurbita pepo subsp. pepo]|uniref:phosphatidylinositol 3,4,5-trisphosphate 3-phosphatase and protein-tyrosine-phosphatase PTEN1-like isoform X3 n=1 Tax=Cucurbita pepo subsp. pepo TaxID=3664 RepID=UPI000C9D447F|nr:phosphatidylinositol 3,4,5-trisphosphate 3-phosphatase and protein-tyrosine-phosphatase PTEN1-like isoform X3 [Cucurbita pepo subsp. pepo]
MGIKFSKQGQGKVENLSLQHHLMNYLSKKFYIRNLVSKQRRRMLVAGYDLDMSYITDHILAMSFPAERMRAMYRNPLWQVKSVLDMRHQGHYKAGKGRTGLMVCAYLVYCGMSVEDALHLYAQRRTTNNEGVSIPSQRRYVGYWAKCLSFPKGVYNGSPEVKLPIPCRRELQRIRLYDTVNTESIFFVVSELQEVPSQLYRPSMERTRSCCRQFKSGYESSNSPRYFLSFVEGENEENKSEVEPRFIVQMDTECSALYHKTCLDYNFEKPLPLTGDVRIIFYAKMFGGRLFYACFNSAFIKNSLIQLRLQDLDKVGKKGRSICGPSFCLELVFGPANAKHSFSTSSEDECPRYDSS